MTAHKQSGTNERGEASEPGKAPRKDDGARVKPGEKISDKDRRIGREIKQEQPSDAESGYANNDNVPNP